MLSTEQVAFFDKPPVRPNRVHIVDFGFARLLELGPGLQPAVELPNTVWERPREGATHFDPYAWDMLCVGRAFKTLLRVSTPLGSY